MKRIIVSLFFSAIILSCRTTVDMEIVQQKLPEEQHTEIEPVEAVHKEPAVSVIETIIEPRVVYIDKPVYYPVETPTAALAGKDAVKQHLSDVQKQPQYENGRLRSYQFQDDWVYEIHCQTYHTTDIQLEPGEEVLETPYISEPDVWQMSAGVSRKDGKHVQHFFIKPDFINLRSNLIIVTNKRVYHMELRSFVDYYMPIVRWTYPSTAPMSIFSTVPEKKEEKAKAEAVQKKASILEAFGIEKDAASELTVSEDTISSDYQMILNEKKRPVWTPTAVFDDGKKTFIVLDRKSLQIEYPALFNEAKEIINYRTVKNVLIIDQLVSKATLRLGSQAVTIQKKVILPTVDTLDSENNSELPKQENTDE